MNSWGMEWSLDAEQRERMQRLSRQPGKGTALLETHLRRAALATVTRPLEPREMAEAARRAIQVRVLGPPIRCDRPEVMVPPPMTLEHVPGFGMTVRPRSTTRSNLWT